MTSPSLIEVASSAQELRQHVGEACALLKALANEGRLMLLCQLAEGRRNVSELEALTGIRQPTLSQQLAVLRQEGLVGTERAGRYVYYHLAREEVIQVMQTLWRIYCAPERDDEEAG